MSTGSVQLRQIRYSSAEARAATNEKRKQQNRAAQKTYREKRKRKLQELEELTSRPCLSYPSANTITDMELVTPQSSNAFPPPETETDTCNTLENSDWLFDFITPTAVAPTPPSTSIVPYRMCFPNLPTDSQRALLALKVSAAYTRTCAQTPWTSFDPYRNHLNISTLSFAAGFFANALSLGLTDHMYCNQSAQSSFYRPRIMESPYADTMLLAVQRSFDGLKPDLRPTSTQILLPHHPAIDFFPFPNLRRRLIEGLAQDPPLVDEVEFWEDLKADAIVCWGSAGAEGGGVPWDARSWEAKEWFLGKYRGVLGEEEDELWRASRWWREMRGEYV